MLKKCFHERDQHAMMTEHNKQLITMSASAELLYLESSGVIQNLTTRWRQ